VFATAPAQAEDDWTSVSGPAAAAVKARAAVDYRFRRYRPRPVPPEALPDFTNTVPNLAETGIPLDPSGVARGRFGDRFVYMPLLIARYGLNMLDGYRMTRDPAYLDRAKVNASFLIRTAIPRQGALYFPYRFSWPLFGKRSQLMRAPWYSAMAQGTALRLFVRLNAVTGEQHWRTAANSTFATFVQRRRAKRPWIAFVQRRNGRRYLWFEAWASKMPPPQALSGHIYGLIGVYEYARATGSAAAVRIFAGGATTVRYQAPRFRARGGVSYYSLRMRMQSPEHHCIHIGQLKLLGRMTGDSWFAREARRFATDAPRASRGC
jgi:D-glucuronyl C5-epimerase C-terminus